jgi:hypothetical protein
MPHWCPVRIRRGTSGLCETRGRLVVGAGELISQQVEIRLQRVVAESFRVGEKDFDGVQPCAGVVSSATWRSRTGHG